MKTGRLLEDIKSKSDILDFISSYVQLKQSGQNWKGNCPFHSEKTPSFMVSPSKQIFHCFGCGAGGDVIAFVMKYENISFREALQLLAKRAGIPLPAEGANNAALRSYEKMRDVLLDASKYYASKLKESPPAAEYLRDRGIAADSIEVFGIGYAPEGWNNLIRHLRGSGRNEAMIKEAGLAIQGNKGCYDMFRHRIIFPITSVGGGVLAFGGRSLDGSLPKYINSPETAVFKKSETLFGLPNAKDEIRRSGRVIIVEGYMDVVICHQHGFKNAVAPLGTALTPAHIRKLKTLCNKSVLVFDGDSAGRRAARRGISLICQNDYAAKVLLLPEGEDPDSYLRKYGEDSFGGLLNEAKTAVDFLFSVPYEDKLSVVREALSMIAGVKDLLLADEMLAELSDRAHIHEAVLREEFKKVKGGARDLQGARRPVAPSLQGNEEYLLLSTVLASPEKSDYVLSRLDIDYIRDKIVVSLFKKIASLGGIKEISQILDISDEEERRIITRLSLDPGLDPECIDESIEGCFRRIEERKLAERLRMAQTSGDPEFANSLLIEKRSLEGKK